MNSISATLSPADRASITQALETIRDRQLTNAQSSLSHQGHPIKVPLFYCDLYALSSKLIRLRSSSQLIEFQADSIKF